MSELAVEYEGKITAITVPVTTEEGQAAVQKYGWQQAQHGLVTLSPDGKMVGTIPGHRYGKKEIRAKVEELLKAD